MIELVRKPAGQIISDSELVAAALGGDLPAYGQL